MTHRIDPAIEAQKSHIAIYSKKGPLELSPPLLHVVEGGWLAQAPLRAGYKGHAGTS